MSEHHFIIKFDTESGEWSHDVDTEQTKFENGTIWDPITQEWRFGYLGDGKWDEIDSTLSEYFPQAVELLNNLKYVVAPKVGS